MKNKYFLIIIFLIFNIACTSTYYLKPIVGNHTEMFYDDGIPIVTSRLPNSTTQIFGRKNDKNELFLTIYYQNDDSSNSINFNPELIKVTGENTEKAKKGFEVFSAEEYMKRLRHQQGMAAGLQAMNADQQARQAGYSNSKTTSNSSGYARSSNGVSVRSNSESTSYTTTYDESKVHAAKQKSQQQLDITNQRFREIRNQRESELLRITTIPPASNIYGKVVVKFKNAYSHRIYIDIPVGMETHKFIFQKGDK
ncbi:hypothetical protein GYB57_15710 [bacterium]|nr:hypothetical protein [bacterium]